MLMNNNSVSVIICTYQRKIWVEDLLLSISQQTVSPLEIIIVDSTKVKIDYILPKDLEINVIQSSVIQLTYQRNLGVRSSKGEIILHLDDDTFLDKDFIEKILEVFENDIEKKIGAISGYVTNQWGKISSIQSPTLKGFKYLGIYDGNFLPGSISPSGISIELNTLNPFSGVKQTDFISGCSFAVRSNVYKNYKHPEIINGYGGEDKVFSRMIAIEWELCVCGDAQLEHYSAPGAARPNGYIHARSSGIFHILMQKKYGIIPNSTIRLRIYYFFFSLRMYAIACGMFITIVKLKKSIKWFLRASGYMAAALSSADICDE